VVSHLSLTHRASPLLTIADVAAVVRCTRRTVERQIAARQLHVLKVGRAVRLGDC
jgi:excisionase family DNA binding protein